MGSFSLKAGTMSALANQEGPKTYKFEQLADLIIDNEEDIEFSDMGDEDEDDDEEGGDKGDSQLPGVSGLRMRKDMSSHSEAASKRMSVGNLAPGIKVRKQEDLVAEIEQRDFVDYIRETADPSVY